MTASPDLATSVQQTGTELDAAALEAALPTLTDKLAGLSASLNADEQAILSSIVTSASLHLKELQDINVEAEYIYSKPISAAATQTIRAQLVDLPDTLGFTE